MRLGDCHAKATPVSPAFLLDAGFSGDNRGSPDRAAQLLTSITVKARLAGTTPWRFAAIADSAILVIWEPSFASTGGCTLSAGLAQTGPGVLFDRATTWLIAQKVLLPAVTTLERNRSALGLSVKKYKWAIRFADW